MSKARYLEADRGQLFWDMVDLESQLPVDHRARIVWAFVDSLDMSAFYDRIGAREDVRGRPPPDPKIFLSLWLYATLENIGSARAIARACLSDTAFRWLCGGVPMNYHSLSDFRRFHTELLDDLLTQSVGALMAEGLVTMEEIVQDGTKVRANAGKGSFVGEEGLARYEASARARVHRLREELDADPGASEGRARAARERAAREVGERAAQARKVLEKLQKEKSKAAKKHKSAEEGKSERKVSTTDPEARLMMFPGGDTAPGYNVQLAAAGCFIVAHEVTDRRNDTGLAEPMIEQLVERYDQVPERLIVDAGIATQSEIASLSEHPRGSVDVYAPVPQERDDITPESKRTREWRRKNEHQGVKDWRSRMQTEEAEQAAKRRKLIETLNAIVKNRGMGRMLLRGIEKIASAVLLQALANNLMQAHRLRLQAA